jgi:hypothetical protein
MTRLVKGAELSVADSSDLYAKGGSNTGDLGSGRNSRKSSTVLLGQGREIFTPKHSIMEEQVEGDGFGSLAISNPISSVTPSKERIHDLLYSQITTLDFKNITELETQLIDLEFKSVFRLPLSETITDSESPCYLYLNNPASSTPCGTLFFALEFLCFASTLPTREVALPLPLLSILTPLLSQSIQPPSIQADSILFPDGQPVVNFVLPYSYITSVTTHSSMTLAIMNPSISGYILVKTRGGAAHYLSFDSVRVRDRVAGELMGRIRNSKVDGEFFMIGGRNGDEVVPVAREAGSEEGVNKVGLRLLFNDAGLFEDKENSEMWREYIKIHGGDICMVKDFRRLREMILTGGGMPNHYRGDLWMLFTGCWYSRPDNTYYEDLVAEKSGKVGIFTNEIEKDVGRFVSFVDL